MELKYYFLFTVILSFLSLFIFYAFSFSNYYKMTGNKYNFLNNFLFEINGFKKNNKKTYVFPIGLTIVSLLMLSPFILFIFVNKGSELLSYILIGGAIIFISAFFVLNYVKLYAYKVHLSFDAILVCSLIFMIFLEIFFMGSKETYGYVFSNDSIRILLIVIGIVLIVIELFLMFNPSYKKRDRMIKVDPNNFSRPKVCYLSSLEWGTLVVFLLSYSILIISVFY